MIDYNNLTTETSERLIEEKSHLIFSLTGKNPFKRYENRSMKNIDRCRLEKIKLELSKSYR